MNETREKSMGKIQVVSACQNTYQEERVLNFVKKQTSQEINFLNLHYGFPLWFGINPHFIPEHRIKEKLEEITSSSELWIVQGSMGCYAMGLKKGGNDSRLLGVYLAEFIALESKIPAKYFKVAQTGKTIGQGKEVKREAIFAPNFEKEEIYVEWFNKLKKFYFEQS